MATGSGDRRAQLVASLSATGSELQGAGVPAGSGGSALTTIDGFVELFGPGAHTFEAGDYVLSLFGRGLGGCDPTNTAFEPGPARLVWFAAQ